MEASARICIHKCQHVHHKVHKNPSKMVYTRRAHRKYREIYTYICNIITLLRADLTRVQDLPIMKGNNAANPIITITLALPLFNFAKDVVTISKGSRHRWFVSVRISLAEQRKKSRDLIRCRYVPISARVQPGYRFRYSARDRSFAARYCTTDRPMATRED